MLFLIVFLLYACYQPLRFSIEDPERQARYASVFAIVAGAFVPLNSWRCGWRNRSPTRACSARPAARCRATCGSTFLVALVGMACLFVTLWKYELASKSASIQLRSAQAPPRRRARPGAARAERRARDDSDAALPLDDAGPYVAAAYLVFLALILIYVVDHGDEAGADRA